MKNKNSVITILIVIVLIIIAIVSIVKLKDNKAIETNIDETQNTVTEQSDNTDNNSNLVSNNIDNENKVQDNNETSQETYVPASAQSVYEDSSDVGSTNKKEEAIKLVKEKWGDDNTVSFTCDSVTKDGEYIVAVVSINTATVKNYFKVNLQNKTVVVDY